MLNFLIDNNIFIFLIFILMGYSLFFSFINNIFFVLYMGYAQYKGIIISSLCFSFLAFFFPTVQFYLTLFASMTLLFFTLPYVDFIFKYRHHTLILFLRLLDQLYIIKYFMIFFIDFFDKKDSQYLKNMFLISFLCLLHLFVSRYLFFHHLDLASFNPNFLFFLYFLLFLGMFGTSMRFFLSTQ